MQESGGSLARVAVGADVKGLIGAYYEGENRIESSEVSYDERKQEDLWKWTIDTVASGEVEKKLLGFSDF